VVASESDAYCPVRTLAICGLGALASVALVGAKAMGASDGAVVFCAVTAAIRTANVHRAILPMLI